jgi:hypothetical protein
LSKDAATPLLLIVGTFCPGKSDLERTFAPAAVPSSAVIEMANGNKNGGFFKAFASSHDWICVSLGRGGSKVNKNLKNNQLLDAYPLLVMSVRTVRFFFSGNPHEAAARDWKP